MNGIKGILVGAGFFWVLAGAGGGAQTVSYTGAPFGGPAGVLGSFEFNLSAQSMVTVQTYGFGGGVNAAGQTIAPGGFDPFIGIFDNGPAKLFLDGTADTLSDFTPGCPPAGTVQVGSVPGVCGDVTLSMDLPAGDYFVAMSDALYLPAAVFESGGSYEDGYIDLTGDGGFQTCVDAADCNTDTGGWAVDITTTADTVTATPEPPAVELAGTGVLLVVAWMYGREKREARGEQ